MLAVNADHDALPEGLMKPVMALLSDHGIAHGPLREGPQCLNLNATDQARVFIKVSRKGEKSGRAAHEVAGALSAAAAGVRVSTPLIPNVVTLEDEDGEPRNVSVWRWETTVTPPSLRDQAAAGASFLATLAGTPAPPTASKFSASQFIARVRDRLHGNHTEAANRIRTCLDEVEHQISARLDPVRYTWIHGDLHSKNLMWTLHTDPLIVDWETHSIGPVEFDIAQLLRSVLLDFPLHDAQEKQRASAWLRDRIETQTPVSVDWDLVNLFARVRSASAASHLLLHGYDPARTNANLALINQWAA